MFFFRINPANELPIWWDISHTLAHSLAHFLYFTHYDGLVNLRMLGRLLSLAAVVVVGVVNAGTVIWDGRFKNVTYYPLRDSWMGGNASADGNVVG
jgi:hypothetical protein